MGFELNDYVALILGLACAGFGGELFVRGLVGVAGWLRISPGIVGATVAAFATSSPELSVGVISAAQGVPQISFGDVLGSNVANIALVLGAALCFSSISVPRGSVRRAFSLALAVPALTAVFAFDGVVSRLDGLLLLALFLAWIVSVTLEARRERSAAEEVLGEHRAGLALALSAVGLVLLFVSGQLIVTGAGGIARSFGIGEFVIGATVVAIGTSIPELATTLISQLRGHEEVGIGTILGSNIFNGLLIVATASTIHPIEIGFEEVAVALLFGALTVGLSFPSARQRIERSRGVVLLVIYGVYLVTVVQRGGSAHP